MRVLIVNTSEMTGGAAIAARRLMEALKNNGIKAKMLVRDKCTDQISVVALQPSWTHRLKFVWERIVIWKANRFKKHKLFEVDIANTGTDITGLPEFQQSDVIHLHWINQGFLSLNSIRKILESGKPVVWTLHDMWPFTGICHYSGPCDKYRTECGRCPLLFGNGCDKDLSNTVFMHKRRIFRNASISFVACSQWLGNLARKSALIGGQSITVLPNTVNTNLFHPTDQAKARLQCNLPEDKKLLLFGSLKATDERKGIDYLIKACELLYKQHPEWHEELGIVIVGRQAEQMRHMFPFTVYPIDYTTDERRMAQLYNAVNVFVTPSLQDNLPNTIVEAMSCGTPCVGFETGGIPEMIDHRTNGYVARYKDTEDLAAGICYSLDTETNTRLRKAAYRKAVTTYSESNVAMKYIEVYNRAIGAVRA